MTSGQRLENYLNELYSSCYSEDEAVEAFIYLNHKNRKARAGEVRIRRAYQNRKLGTLLRQFDIVAFSCAKTDHNFK